MDVCCFIDPSAIQYSEPPASDPRGWTKPRGRSRTSWLPEVEAYLKDMGMTGPASA